MRTEAAVAGFYKNDYINNTEKIKIVTVKEIIDGDPLLTSLTQLSKLDRYCFLVKKLGTYLSK